MDPVLRQAVPADAPALSALDRLANPNPWHMQRFSSLLSAQDPLRGLVLVLEERGSIVGFAVFSQVLDEGSLDNIAVAPAQRRRGCARILVEQVLARLRRTGALRCLLEVRRSNEGARALYDALGFTLDGVRRNYYARPGGAEDGLLLSRQL